jgi:prevent-host-death family protein
MTKFTVSVSEAKTQLSRLLERVRAGEEVMMERHGVRVARLVPVETGQLPRFGTDRGRVVVKEDFDAPLPEDLADLLRA